MNNRIRKIAVSLMAFGMLFTSFANNVSLLANTTQTTDVTSISHEEKEKESSNNVEQSTPEVTTTENEESTKENETSDNNQANAPPTLTDDEETILNDYTVSQDELEDGKKDLFVPFASTIKVGHTGRIGSVSDGSGTTIINNIFIGSNKGVCAERFKNPVDDANYSDTPALVKSKQAWGVWIGFDDPFSQFGFGDTSRHCLASALAWYGEGTLSYNATVECEGNDVSAQYRQAIDKLEEVWNDKDKGIDISFDGAESVYDEATGTLKSGVFTLTGLSADTFSIQSGFYVTRENDNNAVSSLEKNVNYVARTTDLNTDGTIRLTATTQKYQPSAFLYDHPTMKDLQKLMMRPWTDPFSFSSDLDMKFVPATVYARVGKDIINNTITSYPIDYTQIDATFEEIGGTYKETKTLNADGWSPYFEVLPNKQYKITETNRHTGLVVRQGTVIFDSTGKAGEYVDIVDKFENEVLKGKIGMTKKIINDSAETFIPDYRNYGMTIVGKGVNKTYMNQDKDINYVESEWLPYGDYKVTEFSTDGATIEIINEHNVQIREDLKVYSIEFENEVAYVDLDLEKRDIEYDTPILKAAKFGLYEYDPLTATTGKQLQETDVTISTGKFGFKNIPIQNKNGIRYVIVHEIDAPTGYYKEEEGIVFILTKDNHKTVINAVYYNVPEKFAQLQLEKNDSYGTILEGIEFDLSFIDGIGGNVIEKIDTMVTNKNGKAVSLMFRINDKSNNLHFLRLEELRSNENRFYVLADPYDFQVTESGMTISLGTITNKPKELNVTLFKSVEDNPINMTSDGIEFKLIEKNTNREIQTDIIVKDGKATATNLDFKDLLENTEYCMIETKTKDGLILDSTPQCFTFTTWDKYEDGDTISINDKDNPFINKFIELYVEFDKADEHSNLLSDIEFNLVDNKDKVLEAVKSDFNGHVLTNNKYKIFMFNAELLSHFTETKTNDNMILLTENIDVPVIFESEFKNYKDGDIVQANNGNLVLNEYKEVKFYFGKIAELNDLGIKANGTEFTLFNSKDEAIQVYTVKDDILSTDYLKADVLNDGVGYYFYETKTLPQFKPYTEKIMLPQLDWKNIENQQEIKVTEKPIVNEFKRINYTIEKHNEYDKAVKDVVFGEFALLGQEVTEEEEIIETVNKTAEYRTDDNGVFVSNDYPIYMYNGAFLYYVQELETDRDMELFTKKIMIPKISVEDYDKYTDGQTISISDEPIINYYTRYNLGWYKMDEEEFGVNATYGLFDGNKTLVSLVKPNDNIKDIEGYTLEYVIKNVRKDIFINEDLDSKNSEYYIKELDTGNVDLELDYNKYYLPNLLHKDNKDKYKDGDTIYLNSLDEAFINYYYKGSISLEKIDEKTNEPLIIEGVLERVTDGGTELTKPYTETFTTDKNGKWTKDNLVSGEYCIYEVKEADGYESALNEDGTPRLKECFTVDKEHRDFKVIFTNKKSELLVATGSNGFSILVALSIGLILLSISFLYMVRSKTNVITGKMKKSYLSVVALVLVGLCSFTLNSINMNAHTEILSTPSMSEYMNMNKVDPVNEDDPDITVIKDPIGTVTPPPTTEIVTNPPSNDGGNGQTPSTPSDTTESDTTYIDYEMSSLTSAGENLIHVVYGIYLLLFGSVLLIINSIFHKKNMKDRDNG